MLETFISRVYFKARSDSTAPITIERGHNHSSKMTLFDTDRKNCQVRRNHQCGNSRINWFILHEGTDMFWRHDTTAIASVKHRQDLQKIQYRLAADRKTICVVICGKCLEDTWIRLSLRCSLLRTLRGHF